MYPLKVILALAFLGFVSSSCDEGVLLPVKKPKLSYYVESFQFGEEGYTPQSRVDYRYDGEGRLTESSQSTYNSASHMFKEESRSVFVYNGFFVEKIIVFLAIHPDPYKTYDYEYANGSVSKITERYVGSSFSSTASFDYTQTDTVSVTYTAANGNSFKYKFSLRDGNIGWSQTTKGSQVCNEGEFAYDTYQNPFHELGYLDFHLLNYSENNKLNEDISYLACSFPELVADRYEYQYNSDRFPVSAKTIYVASGDSQPTSRKEFFYLDE